LEKKKEAKKNRQMQRPTPRFAAGESSSHRQRRYDAMESQAGYAVGWGTLALINAGLAQAKGRSGLLWFIASLLLGPIATFLIVILEKVEKS